MYSQIQHLYPTMKTEAFGMYTGDEHVQQSVIDVASELEQKEDRTVVGEKRQRNHIDQEQDETKREKKKTKSTRNNGDVAVVMPPSAKSILERREKAIREGRRKDAKLSEVERRILRRLRNRESAERCRLRRVQQALALEKKIESMQVENKRLIKQAEEYLITIRKLETVIEQFSANVNNPTHKQPQALM